MTSLFPMAWMPSLVTSLIQDLAMACPLAQLATKICFANDSMVQLYKDHLFVNFDRVFISEDLSIIMKKYNLPHIQFSMTINHWRHIQTARKHKLNCASKEVMEINQEDDMDTLQAGHMRMTKNHIYGHTV